MTKNGGVFAAESADGRFLYYSKFEEWGIWRMPWGAGKKNAFWIGPGSTTGLTGHSPEMVFTSSIIADNGAVLEFFDFATGKTTTVLTSNRPQSVGLAVTADGRSILYVESELEESSIMLVKNFR